MIAELHPDRFAVERQHMVEAQLRARGIRDQRLLNAMAIIPRHEFVEARYRGQAYEDHPLPIDAGQTISQPYIVALMLELLQLDSTSRVLEIGTGSGYQAAVLSKLAGQVYTVERHPELARQAADTVSPCTTTQSGRSDDITASSPVRAAAVTSVSDWSARMMSRS